MQDTASVPSTDVLLDGPTVATMLHVSTFYVRRNVPHVKLAAKCLRYRMSDVQAFIASRESKKV